MNDLKLPEHLREKLKKPFGNLITDNEIINLIRGQSPRLIICVGDKTSEKILALGILPKICIYDGKIMRKDIKIPDIIKNFTANEIRAKNPAGYITQELFNAIDKALTSNGNFKIFVDGEEDLAAIAAVDLAPIGSLVLYGQPGEGMVIVRVDKKSKEFVGEILREMIEIDK